MSKAVKRSCLFLAGVLFILPLYAYSKSFFSMTLQELRVAAFNGSVEAKVELADRYFFGRGGVSQSDAYGVQLYREAAEEGSIAAMQKMGYLYDQNIITDHISADAAAAAVFYEKVLNKALELQTLDISDSHSLLIVLNALFIMHARGRHSSELFLNNALSLYKKVYSVEYQGKKRFELYKKAEQGDISAVMELSRTAPETSFGEAQFLLMTAAKMGSVKAMLLLAHDYRYGNSAFMASSHTIRQAAGLLKQAFGKGSFEAAEDLAEIYTLGILLYGRSVIKPNLLLSRSYHQAAAELGSFSSKAVLAEVYEKGYLGVRPNLQKAVQYHVMVLEAADSGRFGESEDFYVKKKKGSISFLQKTANDGDVEALHQLGRLYSGGLKYLNHQLIPQNTALAVMFFERAAEQNHERARADLLNMVPQQERRAYSRCISLLGAS